MTYALYLNNRIVAFTANTKHLRKLTDVLLAKGYAVAVRPMPEQVSGI